MPRFFRTFVALLGALSAIRALATPQIFSVSLSQLVTVGSPVTLSASALNASLQWKHNGQAIAGATTSTLTIAHAALSDRGYYEMVATDASGSASAISFLTVGVPHNVVYAWPATASPPAAVTEVAMVARANAHNIALKLDGSVATWDDGGASVTLTPAGVQKFVRVAVSAGSYFALTSGGAVTAWGTDTVLNSFAASQDHVVEIAAGDSHLLALRSDGSVSLGGANDLNQITPTKPLANVVAVAAAKNNSFALLHDGTPVYFGSNIYGTSGATGGELGATQVSAGQLFALVVKGTGAVDYFEADINPVAWSGLPAAVTNVSSVATGTNHAVALKNDGSVFAWGSNNAGQTSLPAGLGAAITAGAGGDATLFVLPAAAPAITAQPVANTVATGGDQVVLGATIYGVPPLTYQWKKDGVAVSDGNGIAGSGTATLTINPVTGPMSGQYTLVATDSYGSATTSAAALTVQVPPAITQRPLSQVATIGQALTFSVAATDPGAISYQWRHNGSDIAGATTATYSIASARLADRGYYEVVASNAMAAARSVFYLTVTGMPVDSLVVARWGGDINTPLTKMLPVPSGVNHPVAITSYDVLQADGTLVGFSDTVAPPDGLDVSNIVAVSGTSSHVLALRADETLVGWGDVTPPAGLRNVVAIGSGGTGNLAVKSDGTVVAWASPGFSAPTLPAGLNNVVSVAAGDYSAVYVALRQDGTLVQWGSGVLNQTPAGLTNVTKVAVGLSECVAVKADGTVVEWGNNFTRAPAAVLDAVDASAGLKDGLAVNLDGSLVPWGTFQASAASVYPTATLSQVVTAATNSNASTALVTAQAPVILTQLAGGSFSTGARVMLSVSAAAAPLPTYQWRKDGALLADGGEISGSATAQLTITGAQPADSGNYTVTISNSLGSVASAAAAVKVGTPPAITQRPLSQRVAAGATATFTVAATDPGTIAYQWKRKGQAIAGATTATLTLANVARSDEGLYEVDLSNGNGGVARSFMSLYVSVRSLAAVGWAQSDNSQLAQLTAGSANFDVVALACGATHVLALKADGSISVWGDTTFGEGNIPAGMSNVVMVAAVNAGSYALLSDGTVKSWGQIALPTTSITNAVAIEPTRDRRLLVLKADGTLFDSGGSYQSSPPAYSGPFVGATGNDGAALGVQVDGTVTGWGVGQLGDLPVPHGLAGVQAIADGGEGNGMALLNDGTVVTWGAFANVPAGLNHVVAIAANHQADYALKDDSSLVVWDAPGVTLPVLPSGLAQVSALYTADDYAFALVPVVQPSIVTQPANQVVLAGPASFHVVAAGTAPLTYQWSFNGSTQIPNLSGSATADTLALAGVTQANTGTYSVTVTNAWGSVTSASVTLSGPPVIAGPGRVSAVLGSSATLTAVSSVTDALTYQWRLDGEPIAGATGATYTTPVLTRYGGPGTYDVVVTDGPLSATSPAAGVLASGLKYPGHVTLDPASVIRAEKVQGWIYATAVGSDGKIYIGGDFSSINGHVHNRLARFNADGTLDDAFAPSFSGAVYAIRPTSGGRVWVGGKFTITSGANTWSALVCLSADGSIDQTVSFRAPSGATVETLALQSDGQLLFGGRKSTNSSWIGRVTTAGVQDTSFTPWIVDPASGGGVFSLAVQPDGRILIGGYFAYVRNQTMASGDCIARVLADGSLDTSFGINSWGADNTVTSLVVQADGRIVLGGFFGQVDQITAPGLARLASNGQFDATFNQGGKGLDNGVYSLVQQADGKIDVGGAFTTYNGTEAWGLMRITSSGTRDTTLPETNGEVSSLALQSDGSVVAVGNFFTVGNAFGLDVARIRSTGALDTQLAPIPLFPGKVDAILPLPNGKVLLGGYFQYLNGSSVNGGVAQLNADLSADKTFNSGGIGASSEVTQLASAGDGRIWIAGAFHQYNGATRNYLARLNADGTLDTTFAPGTGPDVAPTAIVPATSARLTIAGAFKTWNGAGVASTVLRLASNGGIDQTLPNVNVANPLQMVSQPYGLLVSNPSVAYINQAGTTQTSVLLNGNNPLLTSLGMARQPDGDLVGDSIGAIRRFDPTMKLDPSYQVSSLTSLSRLDAQADDKVFVSSTAPNGPTSYLGLLGANGTVDTSFAIVGLTGGPTALALLDDGRLLIAGPDSPGVTATIAAALPVFTTQPQGQTINESGGTLTLTASATSTTSGVTYQWMKDGVAIAGATSSSYVITLSVASGGNYTVVATGFGGSTTSAPALVSVLPSFTGGIQRGLLQAPSGTADLPLTTTFTIEGKHSKPVLIRAVGPTLATLGVSGYLPDPVLTVYSGVKTVAGTNDNWEDNGQGPAIAAATTKLGIYPLATGSKDAALLQSFNPGTYRVSVGPASTTGLVSLEVYEVDEEPRIVYLATRASVPSGGGMIQGLTVGAPQAGRSYLIRALGPSLGLPGQLGDPRLAIYSGNTLLASNDDWGGDAAIAAASLTAGLPPLSSTSKDAALLFTPPQAGTYTIQVSGLNAAGGLALVDISEIDAQRSDTMDLGFASLPVAAAVNVGQTIYLGVVAIGKPIPTFQWYYSGGSILFENKSVYTLPNAAYQQDPFALYVSGMIEPAASVKMTYRYLHSADTDGDLRMSLLELTRVIELYNTRNGSVRTGAYRMDPDGEDGFAPDPARTGPATAILTTWHSADTDHDGKLSLLELTRVIELYNYRSGTTRTGQYHAQSGTEDGFDPGT